MQKVFGRIISVLLGLFMAGCTAGTSIDSASEISSSRAIDAANTGAGLPGSGQDLILYNGQFTTMAEGAPVVRAVRIRDGRFLAVGETVSFDGDFTAIDLKGRRVVPGLIDSQAHFIRAGSRPGHDVRALESAGSIAEFQNVLKQSASSIPKGEFITAVGGFSALSIAEGRLPTLAELDAALPDHPVYLQSGPFGPAVTNSHGREFFLQAKIAVGENGEIARGRSDTVAAFMALDAKKSSAHTVYALDRLMTQMSGLGLTTVLDNGGLPFPGPGYFDPASAYEPVLALWRDGRMQLRVRVNLMSRDGPELTSLRATLGTSWPNFGDDMLRVNGVGEEIVARRPPEVPSHYLEAGKMVAADGWSQIVHAADEEEVRAYTSLFEEIDATYPLADLRWGMAHVFDIDQEAIARLKEIGVGVTVQSQQYLGDVVRQFVKTKTKGGPPFKSIVESGIHVGGGSDGSFAPLNPWVSLYYMVTGRNGSGELVNADQTITREQALRIYTIGSAWFTHDEEDLGSISEGKLADLVVLDRDYMTIQEDDIKNVRSSLTLVGGKIMHSDESM